MSAKLLVDPHKLAELIAQSVREVLDARGLDICKARFASADLVRGQDLDDLYQEIGRNTAAAAGGIDESEAV